MAGDDSRRRGYGGAGETAAVRSDAIGQIVTAQADLMRKSPIKTPLSDLQAVQAVAADCMKACAEAGCLPNFEMFAAALGLSRRGLYDYLERHPDSQTAEFIDQLRTGWAGMRQMAADKGIVDGTVSIFILLNSSLGFSNEHKIEIAQPQSPLTISEAETQAIRDRYLAAIPTDVDD